MKYSTGKLKDGKLIYVRPRKLSTLFIVSVVAAMILVGMALSSITTDGYGMCYVIGGKAYCYPIGPPARK